MTASGFFRLGNAGRATSRRDGSRAGTQVAAESNAPLVVFRVLFGLLMLLESWGALATGWVHEVFVEPIRTYPLLGFEWLRVLSGEAMYGYFAVMGLASLGVALGWRYRASAAALALLWTGAYLAQKLRYNNHYYLAVLVAWAMALLPAADRASLDVAAGRRARRVTCHPWIARGFRLQLAIVFGYAALAKLYPGWLEGDYLRVNLGSKGDRWPLGGLVIQPWFQEFTVWAALIFDALVIPLLWWRRTRVAAFVGLVVFNLFNSIVFRIGIFPYMVLAMTVFFFSEEAVERAFRWIPGMRPRAPPPDGAPATARLTRPVAVAVALYFAVQLALPLRHHLIRGDVTWTEEGHRMSWRMMLRTKQGWLVLTAQDPSTGRSWRIDLSEYLTPLQQARAAEQPEALYQLVQDVKRDYHARGIPDLRLFARSAVSLNGAPPAPLYDPTYDLARATWSRFTRNEWVLDPPDPETRR